MEQINISDSCLYKVADLLAEENDPNLKLRVFVQGGGCSGFQYGFTFDEAVNEDDFVIEKESVVKPYWTIVQVSGRKSFKYLCKMSNGAERWFKETQIEEA